MFHANSVRSPLAGNPTQLPHYSVTIKSNSKEIICPDPRAMRSLLLLMDQHAVIGGAAAHWGGPSALCEVASALFSYMFSFKTWNEHFNFVNDIGHAENAIYALRALYNQAGVNMQELKSFRSYPSRLTGHGESHLFPQGVMLSNGPLGSAFPQSQGLAAADKLLGNKRSTVCLLSDGAFMEGEAKEALSAIAGLTQKGRLNPYLLIISFNDTKLSGRINQDSFDLASNIEALEVMGWDLRHVANGHDLPAVYQSIEKAHQDLQNNSTRPICLCMHTKKGQGLAKTVAMPSGGHGYHLKKYDPELLTCLKELWNNEVPKEFEQWAQDILNKKPQSSDVKSSAAPKEKIQAGFGRAAIAARKKGLPVVSISADLQGSTGIAPFHKEFPAYSYDVGVAESNMISMASGLSKLGFLSIVDTFVAFGATKGNLPLIMASLSQAPVLALFTHLGFQDAADGASHQSLTYFSALCSIPNTTIICPASALEAERLMLSCLEKMHQEKTDPHAHMHNYIFVTGREDAPSQFGFEDQLSFGSPRLMKEGKQGIIVTQGNLLGEGLLAVEILKNQGVNFGLVHHPFLNTFDKNTWKSYLDQSNGVLLSVEDHQEKGGIGSFLLGQIENELPGILKRGRFIGVKNCFGQSAYASVELYKHHGLDAHGIAKTALEMLT